MTRTVAICSQKGGVGKTSLTQNLGAELARTGERVLVVDFDPQSNLTSGWGFDPVEERPTVYTAMLDPTQAQACVIQHRPNMDLLPADLDLSGAELQFLAAVDRNTKLKKALAPLKDGYDFILIDGPPSLGFYTVNALTAATELIIPLQAQVYAYKALDQLLNIVGQVQEINPSLQLSAVVLTMYDIRNSLTSSVEEQARKKFGDLVMQTVIPVNVRIAEAPLDGVSVREYAAESKGAEAYTNLAKEILDRG
ncbi:ParA family protein [Chloroflexi bacterium TSY]|nr:ParA family protein [Chloroflexi bacterium TSY]